MAGSPLDKSLVEDQGKRNFYNSGLFEMLAAREAAQDMDADCTCVEFSIAELLHTGTTCGLEIGTLPDFVAEQAVRFGFRTYIGPSFRSGRWYTDDGRTVKYAWDEAAGNTAFESAVKWIEETMASTVV